MDLIHHVNLTINVAGATLSAPADGKLEAYGTTVHLHLRDGSTSRARYESRLKAIWFPLETDTNEFRAAGASSRVLLPIGECRIAEAGWVLPVAAPAAGHPANLGQALGAGSLALLLGSGLHATVPPAGFDKPLPVAAAFLLVDHASLAIVANTAATRYRHSLSLWRDGDSPERKSHLELSGSRPLRLYFDATLAGGGAEALAVLDVACRTHCSRPVTARGSRVPFESGRAVLGIQRTAADMRITVDAATDAPLDPVTGAPRPAGSLSFALSNAFVRTGPALGLKLSGVLTDEHEIRSGTAALTFAASFLLPSLPDPYAANTRPRVPREMLDPASNLLVPIFHGLTARVSWTPPEETSVAFELSAGAEAALAKAFVPIEEHPFHVPSHGQQDFLPAVEARFSDTTGLGREVFRLLDVSSRADQFGIGFSGHERRIELGGSLALRGLDLIAPLRNVPAFILPAFQWETVHDIPNPKVLPGFPPELMSRTDGGPSRFAITSGTLVPVAPIPVIDTLVAEYNAERDRTLAARFTLPFGLVAAATLRKETNTFIPIFDSPHVRAVRPSFSTENCTGGRQISLTPAVHILQTVNAPDPGLPGITTQTEQRNGGFQCFKSSGITRPERGQHLQ